MLDIWLPNRSLEEAMQRSNHQDVKLHLLECKATPIMVQSYKHQECKATPIMVQSYQHQDAIPNFFDFNSAYLLTINSPLSIERQSASNCIIIQFECIFMQF